MLKQRDIVTCIILTIITFGIYGIYFWYKAGQRSAPLHPGGDDMSVIYLIVSIIGFGIINSCLLQDNINQYLRYWQPPFQQPPNQYPPQQ